MHTGPRTLRTMMIVLGSSWFPLLLNVLRVLVLPSKLGDGGLGQVTLAISFTGFFGVFTALGTSTYLVRAVARDKKLTDSYITNALLLRVVMGLDILGVLMGVANLLGYSTEAQTVIAILGLSMIIITISNVFESGLQALGQMSWRAIATAIGQGTATMIGVGLLLMGANATLYALSIPLGAVLQFAIVLSYYFLRHPITFSLDRSVMRALLIGGMPLFLWGFLQTAYGQIDATILSLFADKHVIGWFGAASQITNVLIVIPGAISAVALPILCELYVKPESNFGSASSRSVVTTMMLMAPIGGGLAISAGDLLHLLPYPAVFMNSVPALTLMALALPVTGVLMVLCTLAIAIGQERQWVKISAFAVCIFPPLYVVLIWWFQTSQGNGATGAALANLIGESALLVWAWIVLPSELKQGEMVRKGIQVAGLALVMVVAVGLLQRLGIPLLVYAPIGGVIYVTGAWLLKLITPSDLQLVRRAVLRRGRHAEALPEPLG